MKKALILVHDEELGKKIEKLIVKGKQRVSVFCTMDTNEAYSIILTCEIELVIVDVVLQKGNPEDISGIHFVTHMRKIKNYEFVPVIMISPLTDHKMYAYSQLHCYGFLEKPFSFRELESLIQQALHYEKKTEAPAYIPFRQGGVIYPILVKDIVYIEHKRRKMYVHTKSECVEIPYHTCEQTLTELECFGFVLCARGVIVNKKYIYALDTANHFVVLKDGLGSLELGRKYLNDLKAVFEKRR